ncbi:hypothetical protein NEILACOT_04450 [Neisseria lactamica ATCC 23970]|uniref:Uncharacterized protein n=1 Tax=Neisseria lactamica ATCC 23970 TaxID=546265 RepID=D0WA82_NEILA|nr:hypothetical protein NEILACOT_04450 [Neisseria lactamica ATCC 23970]
MVWGVGLSLCFGKDRSSEKSVIRILVSDSLFSYAVKSDAGV